MMSEWDKDFTPRLFKDLYIYIDAEGRIVRTGLLLYYDPLFLSDLYEKTLEELCVVDHTLRTFDPFENALPDAINAKAFKLVFNRNEGLSI